MDWETTGWKPTGTLGLYVREPGGGFYARIRLNGKRTCEVLRRTGTGRLRTTPRFPSGHTRQVSTLPDDKRHAALVTEVEFRRRDVLLGESGHWRRGGDLKCVSACGYLSPLWGLFEFRRSLNMGRLTEWRVFFLDAPRPLP